MRGVVVTLIVSALLVYMLTLVAGGHLQPARHADNGDGLKCKPANLSTSSVPANLSMSAVPVSQLSLVDALAKVRLACPGATSEDSTYGAVFVRALQALAVLRLPVAYKGSLLASCLPSLVSPCQSDSQAPHILVQSDSCVPSALPKGVQVLVSRHCTAADAATLLWDFRPMQAYEHNVRVWYRNGRSRKERFPQLTVEELMALPLRPGLTPSQQLVTCIVTIHKRHHLIPRFLDTFQRQTHPCTWIWVTAWAPISPELVRSHTEGWRNKSKASNVRLVIGETDLAYFGRFQLGLQLMTPYAVFFDDDCIPGERFIELCMHTIGTTEFRHLLGIKGHRSPYPPRGDGLTYFGPVSQSRQIHEADVVGGAWVVEQEWIKLMFRERVFTFLTGEDYALTSGLRRYAGLHAFVLPTHADPKWCGTGPKAEYESISAAHDSTGGDGAPRMEARKMLETQLYYRGIGRIESFRSWTGVGILVVLDSCTTELRVISPLIQELRRFKGVRVLGVTSGREALCDINFLAGKLSFTHDNYWDLRFGWDIPGRRTRSIDSAAEIAVGIDAVIDAANPQFIVHMISDRAVALGVAQVAVERGVFLLTIREEIPRHKLEHAVNVLSDGVVSSSQAAIAVLTNEMQFSGGQPPR